ncbi:helix-turn-helix domain-containing protein [Staphylococcus pasteuri]|uniref:helix-turn-helix domain-containing protein n=1 Tax=Staphylococcus pasteuri TaxID=45972 RepID=UPI001E2C53F9|nr:helix-turn-helix domain-containing protein [Staphylococcus pasteuri]MCE3021409.1 helix-turn-helix domain-containing protein [Staphylococcus pasteuri]
MKTIGEVLKGRRERLGMTLNELEQRTQLKCHTLEQIENNEFNQLPNSNYAEGFIRKYANVVNIEPNQLIQAHQDEIPQHHIQLDDMITSFANKEAPPYRSKSMEPLQVAAIIVLVTLVTLALWILAVLLF